MKTTKHVPLKQRVFLFEEEMPGLSRSKPHWMHVDHVTIDSMGWGTSKARRALGASEIVYRIRKLGVGDVYVHDGGLGGRTRYTRVS